MDVCLGSERRNKLFSHTGFCFRVLDAGWSPLTTPLLVTSGTCRGPAPPYTLEWYAWKAMTETVVRKGNHAARVIARPIRELVFDPHLQATYCFTLLWSELEGGRGGGRGGGGAGRHGL